MDPSKNAPSGAPKLNKQSSNPIFISPQKPQPSGLSRPGAVPVKPTAPVAPAQRPVARSMPAMRYQPPKAPTNKPREAPCEPPPIELPPSPPIFSELDVQRELDKAAARAAAHAPLSRSLNDYNAQMLSSSVPSNFVFPGSMGGGFVNPGSLGSSFVTPKNFTPAFPTLEETDEPLESPSDHKQSSSYTDGGTIFSMLRTSSMSNGATAPIHSILDQPAGNSAFLGNPMMPGASNPYAQTGAASHLPPGAHHGDSGVDDVFQFSLSLEHPEDSFMNEEEEVDSDMTKYQSAFR